MEMYGIASLEVVVSRLFRTYPVEGIEE